MFVATNKHAPYCLRWSLVLRIQPNMAAMAAISKFLSKFLMKGFFELNRSEEFLLRRLLVHAGAKSESARKLGWKNRKKNLGRQLPLQRFGKRYQLVNYLQCFLPQ